MRGGWQRWDLVRQLPLPSASLLSLLPLRLNSLLSPQPPFTEVAISVVRLSPYLHPTTVSRTDQRRVEDQAPRRFFLAALDGPASLPDGPVRQCLRSRWEAQLHFSRTPLGGSLVLQACSSTCSPGLM